MVVASRAPKSAFGRSVYRALMEEAHDEAMVTVRVAVLLAAQFPRAQIARHLSLDYRQVEKEIKRLRAISERIDRDDEL